MESFIEEFEHLRIPYEEIKLATNNFDETRVIGSHGGFGKVWKVYKGELSHFMGRGMAAIKRLNWIHEQRNTDFWKEIMILNRHKHENLITLLGFCDEHNEKILVYEYAPHGSLDRHLRSGNFTWIQRLKTCLGAARGLRYLHDCTPEVIHGDIKSANIMLDANWNAKVSDTGLSRIVHANLKHTGPFFPIRYIDPNLVYLDTGFLSKEIDPNPMYLDTGFLSKESEVYSFGVELVEVLYARLSIGEIYNPIMELVPRWKESYKQNRFQEIIFDDLKQQMDKNSLNTYSLIAFKCLDTDPKERPTMRHVVNELETALAFQELYEGVKPTKDPLDFRSESELLKGVLSNMGKTWVSLNKDGEYCEMISIEECLMSTGSDYPPRYIRSSEYTSRFAVGCYEPFGANFKTHVRTRFLSLGITYTVNLVFKNTSNSQYIGLEYKLKGEKSNSYSFLSDEREDGWLTAELYQFTSDQTTVDFEIWFYTECCPTLLVEGIEFQPLKVELEVLTHDEVDMQTIPDIETYWDWEHDNQPISDTETYWEQKIPIDYADIIRRSKDIVKWETKKDLYHILCKGFLTSYGEEWFSLTEDGKKCLMVPARAVLEEDRWDWKSRPETRFEEVAYCTSNPFGVFCKFDSKMLSPETTYAAYLAYELPDDYQSVDQPPPVQVVNKDSDPKEVYYIFLRTPQTPVISSNEEKTFNPSYRPKIKSLPKLRTDGWIEVQIREFKTCVSVKMISTRLKFSGYMPLKGLTVQGLEFRPI